ncbi:hypothetical protein H6A66_06765 [Bacteroides caecigallinarum]|uniref:hypothetical protein n=1 Tax=Bacteroides caecigallinarum TaxID=1411144 RepID=UPI00195D7264|nr:hypothetical protein [Bacteroides caecigallinarum]MBM6864871.1 hypothetical protein [Bacteroides caecigallinarum]
MEYSLYWGIEKTNLPLVVINFTDEIGKVSNLCFLIDTGATHNILFTYVYKHFKYKFKLLDEEQSIMGIEGEYKETPVIEATFNFEGQYYTSKFSVYDATEAMKQVQEETGVQIHGVLSITFLIENGWIIDFEKLKIIIKDE